MNYKSQVEYGYMKQNPLFIIKNAEIIIFQFNISLTISFFRNALSFN